LPINHNDDQRRHRRRVAADSRDFEVALKEVIDVPAKPLTNERTNRLAAAVGDPQVRIALLAAGALVVEAVVAKNILDVRLDFISQFAALWVFIAFQLSGRRDRLAEVTAGAAVVVATAAVLIVYAL
jgi:hypothetical protein